MPIVKIPEILRQKLTDNGADALIEVINESEDLHHSRILELVETRFEARLSEEHAKLDKRITDEIARLRVEDIAKLDKRITDESTKLDKRITDESTKLDKRITEESTKLRTEMIERISQSEVRIIRWMFLFWIGQIAVVAAILSALLRK